MIRRKRLSFLGILASAKSILSATSASAILSIAGASLLLAYAVPAQAQSTATVTITTAGTLDSISVLTQGATGLDYAAVVGGTCATGTAYTVSDTCTVKYSFTPTHPWVRYGGISLFDSAHHLLGNVFLNGVGTVPQVSYPLSAASAATALGSGASSPFSVAVDGSGNIYVADPSGPKVYELMAVNGVVPATNPTIITLGSGFTSPSGVAVDGSGNVYVADTGGNAVKELVAVGGTVPATNPAIVPLATEYTFSQPKGIAVDSSGNVYVADTGNGVVVELAATNGVIPSTVTPTVLNGATNGFSQPSGVAVDASGNVYVADTGHSQVKKLAAVSGTVNPLSTPTTLPGSFLNVSGVAVDGSGDLYVAYAGGNVKEIVVGSGGTIPLGSGFTALGGVTVDASGNVYVTDTESGHSLVKELNAQNPPPLTFASTAVGTTSSDSPETLTVANNGNAPLLFAVPTTGSNPSIGANFSISTSSTCPQLTSTSSAASLAVGASCTDVLSFTPTQGGSPLTDSLTTTDNALGSPHAVSLSGTATPAPTTLTLSPLTGSVGIDQSVNFTAIVAQSAGTVAPSGGTVNFSVTTSTASGTSSPVVTPVTLTSGTSFQFSYVPTDFGTVSVTAAYVANSSFQASTSSTSTQSVTQGSTSVSVSGTPSAAYGGSASFTAAVTSAGSGHVSPSGGTVIFTAASSAQSVTLCTAVTLTSGSASCSVSSLSLLTSATPYTITATYSGDPKFPAKAGTLSGGLTVTQATPTVAVTSANSNPTAPVVNQSLTFTAGVSNIPAGGGALGGTFNFTTTLNGTVTPLCSSVPAASPVCVTSLAAGSNAIKATYSGDNNFITSVTPGTLSAPIVVAKGGTQLTLAPLSGSSVVNQPVTFTATIAQTSNGVALIGSIAPTIGTVAFFSNNSAIAECANQPLTSGKANCSTSSLALGTADSITAVYTPTDGSATDPNFNTGTSVAAVTQSVGPAGSQIATLTSSSPSSVVNGQVTFTATVVGVPAGGTLPKSGKVDFEFALNGQHVTVSPSCSSQSLLSSSQSATCTLTSLQAGSYTVTAAYIHDTEANFTSSPVSSLLVQTVVKAATALTIAAVPASSSTSIATVPVTFTATLTPTPADVSTVMTGMITFTTSSGNVSTCSPTANNPVTVTSATNAASTVSCTITFPSGVASPFSVSAAYAGDSNFAASTTPNPAQQTVLDFSLKSPTQLFVTQGYTIGAAGSDPFFGPSFQSVQATSQIYPITVPPTAFPDTVSYVCPVQATNLLTQPNLPTCAAPTAGVLGASGALPLSFTTSGQTSPGDYSVMLTGTDSGNSAVTLLSRSTSAFTVTVVPVSAQVAFAPGGSATAAAVFTVPSNFLAADTFTLGCGQVVQTSTSASGLNVTCAATSTSLGADGSAVFTITATPVLASIKSPADPSSPSAMEAALFGVPLMVFVGWVGRKRVKGSSFVRFLGLLAIMLCLMQATGCGSNGFNTPTKPTTTGSQTGTYLIQVTATDKTNNKTYYSVIPVSVS
jgi:sugar lactone lactonase YvrE